jgi:uncharacterized DUF497 family protein
VVFTWDPKKAVSNLKKHGVGFPEASSVIGDPLATTFPDDNHSLAEHRFVTVVEARSRLGGDSYGPTRSRQNHQCQESDSSGD